MLLDQYEGLHRAGSSMLPELGLQRWVLHQCLFVAVVIFDRSTSTVVTSILDDRAEYVNNIVLEPSGGYYVVLDHAGNTRFKVHTQL
jgi:hypothetical protein